MYLANLATSTHIVATPNQLDSMADTPQPSIPVASVPLTNNTPNATLVPRCPTRNVCPRPLATHDVYVDDFISLAQGNCTISVKKLKKGNAAWTTRKIVLGWIVDTVRLTI
jgi:hypothetical protein